MISHSIPSDQLDPYTVILLKVIIMRWKNYSSVNTVSLELIPHTLHLNELISTLSSGIKCMHYYYPKLSTENLNCFFKKKSYFTLRLRSFDCLPNSWFSNGREIAIKSTFIFPQEDLLYKSKFFLKP